MFAKLRGYSSVSILKNTNMLVNINIIDLVR